MAFFPEGRICMVARYAVMMSKMPAHFRGRMPSRKSVRYMYYVVAECLYLGKTIIFCIDNITVAATSLSAFRNGVMKWI